jgi:hypothetical protein
VPHISAIPTRTSLFAKTNKELIQTNSELNETISKFVSRPFDILNFLTEKGAINTIEVASAEATSTVYSYFNIEIPMSMR